MGVGSGVRARGEASDVDALSVTERALHHRSRVSSLSKQLCAVDAGSNVGRAVKALGSKDRAEEGVWHGIGAR